MSDRLLAQRVTGLEHERESCAIRQVEEFRASDKSGDCCQIPQPREGYRCSREEPEGSKTDGRSDYVPLVSRWRCGSGTTPPHSTQRTLPALCSSSETQSEIRRLCAQAQGRLIGSGCGARPDSSRFTMHLRESKQVLLADVLYRSSLVPAMQDTKYGNVGGPPC